MYQFPQSDPVFQSCVDSQFALLNAFSASLLGSLQSVCDANVKFGQTMLEGTFSAGQRMLTSTSADDALGAAVGLIQPAAHTQPAYERHPSILAADEQVDLAHAAQRHDQDPGTGMPPERRLQSERRASRALQGGRPAA